MRQIRPSIAIAAVALAGCASDASMRSFHATPAPTLPGSRTRHFEFVYEASVKEAPAGAASVDLWLPVADDTPFQQVELRELTAPAGHAVAVEPTLGNKIFHVRVPASSLPLNVRMTYDVVRREQKTDAARDSGAALSAADRTRFLADSKLVPVGARATELAGGFRPQAGGAVGAAREIYDHVLAKMRYSKEGSGWGTGSTEWACTAGYGNCTDFHAYFMSLARTNGMPARFLMGVPLPEDKSEGEIGGYHCWAEFFAEGKGWIPVDISEADKVVDSRPDMVEFYFGGLTADRVEFTTGRDVPLVPAAKAGNRNFFIYPYCEIDGNEAPKEAVTRRFSFRDVK